MNSDLKEVQETRIALAFSGGVALAIYESGVAMEFFRLVSGESVYAALPPYIGKVVVDVLTGTSAGGLNGAFLANALVNGGDMNMLLSLWRDEGDIDKLLYGSFHSNPESLLDGDRFYEKIFEALTAKRPTVRAEPALQPSVDLFITATNLDGDRVDVPTCDGTSFPTRTYRQAFHFRYRDKVLGSNEEAVNEFATPDDIARLAVAARATASFPFAFAPILIRKGQMGPLASCLEADAYHIDGGVLDNKPIAMALKAIAARQADKRVLRRLFFIDPDPEQILPRAGQARARTYSPLEVVLKAAVSLTGYQSLTNALQDIALHNRTVDERKQTLDYLNQAASLYRSRNKSQRIPIAAQAEEDAAHGETKFIPPADRSSAFYRAMEDGYLDLRLERDVSTNLYQSIKTLAEELQPQLDVELAHAKVVEKKAAARHAGATPAAPAEAWPLHSRLFRVRAAILNQLDLKYYQRLYRYQVQLVRDLYPQASPAGPNGAEAYVCVVKTLNGLKDYFYRIEEEVRRQETLEAQPQEAEINRLTDQVEIALQTIRRENQLVKDELENAAAPEFAGPPARPDRLQREACEWSARKKRQAAFLRPLEELLKHVQESPFLLRRQQFVEDLSRKSRIKLGNDITALVSHCPPPPLRAKDGERKDDLLANPEDGYWTLTDALDSFFLRDMIIYPIMQDNEIAAELEQVHFVRISPAEATRCIPGLGGQDKLAGKALAHFGGFLSKQWRGNDLTWGRLDAAEFILKTLLPEEIWNTQGPQLLAQLQEEILHDMERLSMDIYSAGQKKDADHLIGKQTIADIPLPDKIRWSALGVLTFTKILRKSVADSPARWLRGLMSLLDGAVRVLTWGTVAVTVLCKYLWWKRPFRRLFLILVIAGIAWLLWNRSLHDALKWLGLSLTSGLSSASHWLQGWFSRF